MFKNFYGIFNRRTFLILLFVIGYTLMQAILLLFLFLLNSNRHLEGTVNRVKDDLLLKNGKWDVSSYNADGNIQDGHSIYIVTTEGFVIERFRPIHGMLDLSRYTLIANYSVPTTETTVTNEKWRVFSVPIKLQDKPLGILLIAYYDPREENLPEIDRKIKEAASKIAGGVKVEEDGLDVSQIDIRKVPYDISFQIVDHFNKVLLQSNSTNSVGRMPVFIDRSYVDNQLKSSPVMQVEDTVTQKKHLVVTRPILDEGGAVAGVIIAGESIDHIYVNVFIYMVIALVFNLLMVGLYNPLKALYSKLTYKDRQRVIPPKPIPITIKFMKKTCKIVIDKQSIDVPYASFQYYFCDALFFRPKKRWEVDELLELFGEDFGAEKWRKVYDTMVALNRKTSALIDKLFVVKDKRYFINPKLVSAVSHVNS